jgi:hypothetical protein
MGNGVPPGGLEMTVGPPLSRGDPLAAVTAADVPINTSAAASTEFKITVKLGGTSQIFWPGAPVVGAVT